MKSGFDGVRMMAPGFGLALLVAAAATFLSEHYSSPVMLYALLLGMAFNFLTENEQTRAGIEFTSKAVLRSGVALLGMRIGWGQVTALGWEPVVMIVGIVAVTIAASVVMARLMGFNPLFGFLSGGATAICGASAALALSVALPPHEKREQATLFTVIGVSVFSTLAMIAYPLIAHATGLSDHAAGIFIGATIHDVAQVVGAGYAISPDAGDTATIVKLLRVATLLPVILVAGQITRSRSAPGTARPPLLPWFVVGFVVLVFVNSIVSIPKPIGNFANDVSRWCLVTSIAAIGMKTRLGEIVKVGIRPVILMFAETALLAVMVLALLKTGIV
ncbi:YeiH family protein [Aquisediminimonas sediminicola]|uniref:YeiH family protein n=1 Tax=Alteraquisediminimonas sediminicola TaxID=2676787 RepID=UPI001C8CF97E|nr:putative sulfate exporter family transporter [Aquisediminimonas sediminicola]